MLVFSCWLHLSHYLIPKAARLMLAMFKIAKYALTTTFVVFARTIIFLQSISPHHNLIVAKYSVYRIVKHAWVIMCARLAIQAIMWHTKDFVVKTYQQLNVLQDAQPALILHIASFVVMDLIFKMDIVSLIFLYLHLALFHFQTQCAKFAPLDTCLIYLIIV